jgi:hypothetical protein
MAWQARGRKTEVRHGESVLRRIRFRNSRLKRATIPALAIAIAFLFPARELRAGPASFEGTVSVSLTRSGTDTTQFLFTRKGNQLRIEDAAKSKPEPINIVDLDSNQQTIIYPHNSTFVHVDLIRQLPDRAQPGAPQMPPGFPTPPAMNASPGSGAPNSGAATASAPPRPGISPPPGFPTPPPMPSMPQMQLPQMPVGGAPTGAGGAPALPNPMMMPPMPAMMPGGAPELKKTDKTRKIQGFDCVLYTISDRMETFEIWATSDSALFPFRLLERNYHNRHFGPVMLEEQWVELLQKKSLFPVEATLRMDLHPQPANPAANGAKGNTPGSVEHGPERLSFKVDKIEKKKIDNDALFKAPENYYEIQAPQF